MNAERERSGNSPAALPHQEQVRPLEHLHERISASVV
jgi:hypothetical protein